MENFEEIRNKVIGTHVISKDGKQFIITDCNVKNPFSNSFVTLNNGKRYAIKTTLENGIFSYKDEVADVFRRALAVEQRLAEEQRRQEEERRRAEAERQAELERQKSRSSGRKQQRAAKPNIAFKCNYCDGGASESCIGFKGRCSAAVQTFNIENQKHIWCTDPACPCMREHEGHAAPSDEPFVCYESQMLINWTASAGVVRNGDRKGRPMHLANVSANSLAVLTTRLPEDSEENRIIFAVFMVRCADEGDECHEGTVVADEHFRIELTPAEARQMRFWAYYQNSNHVEFWGSGLHRYFDDVTAARILRDIAAVKQASGDGALANELYTMFCEQNRIVLDPED